MKLEPLCSIEIRPGPAFPFLKTCSRSDSARSPKTLREEIKERRKHRDLHFIEIPNMCNFPARTRHPGNQPSPPLPGTVPSNYSCETVSQRLPSQPRLSSTGHSPSSPSFYFRKRKRKGKEGLLLQLVSFILYFFCFKFKTHFSMPSWVLFDISTGSNPLNHANKQTGAGFTPVQPSLTPAVHTFYIPLKNNMCSSFQRRIKPVNATPRTITGVAMAHSMGRSNLFDDYRGPGLPIRLTPVPTTFPFHSVPGSPSLAFSGLEVSG